MGGGAGIPGWCSDQAGRCNQNVRFAIDDNHHSFHATNQRGRSTPFQRETPRTPLHRPGEPGPWLAAWPPRFSPAWGQRKENVPPAYRGSLPSMGGAAGKREVGRISDRLKSGSSWQGEMGQQAGKRAVSEKSKRPAACAAIRERIACSLHCMCGSVHASNNGGRINRSAAQFNSRARKSMMRPPWPSRLARVVRPCPANSPPLATCGSAVSPGVMGTACCKADRTQQRHGSCWRGSRLGLRRGAAACSRHPSWGLGHASSWIAVTHNAPLNSASQRGGRGSTAGAATIARQGRAGQGRAGQPEAGRSPPAQRRWSRPP